MLIKFGPGWVRQAWVWRGVVVLGMARSGWVWRGMGSFWSNWYPPLACGRRGQARHGPNWRGMVGPGSESHG